MRTIVRSRIAACARGLLPARLARFARARRGAAAVEFALVALPFFALLFAILETALVFFAGQSLEFTASQLGRLVMTGQAQNDTSPTTGAIGYTQADFKNVACANLSSLFDCSKLYVSVQTYSSFGSANTSTPFNASTGKMTVDINNLPYDTGSQGSIVVVQLYYQWPIVAGLLDHLDNIDGKRLLVATSVFRNEPF